jgi:hypothetical protein
MPSIVWRTACAAVAPWLRRGGAQRAQDVAGLCPAAPAGARRGRASPSAPAWRPATRRRLLPPGGPSGCSACWTRATSRSGWLPPSWTSACRRPRSTSSGSWTHGCWTPSDAALSRYRFSGLVRLYARERAAAEDGPTSASRRSAVGCGPGSPDRLVRHGARRLGRGGPAGAPSRPRRGDRGAVRPGCQTVRPRNSGHLSGEGEEELFQLFLGEWGVLRRDASWPTPGCRRHASWKVG